MDMQEDKLAKPMDLTVATKLQPNSTDSVMMSPASEPDTTATQLTTEPKPTSASYQVYQENRLIMSVSGESNPEPKQEEIRSSSFTWPNCDMLLLLAEAAEMKEKMERTESSSSNDDSDEHSPLVIDEDVCCDDDDDSKEEDSIPVSNGKIRKHDSSEESASDRSSFRYYLTSYFCFRSSNIPDKF